MKNTLLAIACSIPLFLSAQTAIKKDYPLSPGNDIGTAIFPSGEGYVIFGNKRQGATPTTPFDVYMLRLDANGNQVALNSYGSAALSETIDKGVLALPDGWLLCGGNGTAGYLIQLSNSGAALWTKEVPGTGPFTDAAALPGGGLVATGQLGSNMFVARMADDGTVQWVKTYSTGRGMRITLSSGGGNCFVLNGNQLLKIRTGTGSLVWEKTITPPPFGPPNGDMFFQLRDMSAAGEGRFAVVGYVYNDQATTLYSAYYAALWSESGELLWEKFFNGGNSGFDTFEGNSVTYLPNSGHLLLGGTKAGATVISRIDANGIALDSLNLGIAGYNVSPVVRKTGSYYVATGGTLTTAQDVNTIFYRSAGNALRDGAGCDESCNNTAGRPQPGLYPNPASGSISTSCLSAETQTLRLQVLDFAGRVVLESLESVSQGDNLLDIKVDRLTPGMYWLVVPGRKPTSFVKD